MSTTPDVPDRLELSVEVAGIHERQAEQLARRRGEVRMPEHEAAPGHDATPGRQPAATGPGPAATGLAAAPTGSR